ncbi:MAG: hypothetical protein M0R66_09170 [Candidatus Omnitrophica bacterium]|nr:hypothetical protein [Candidatus Omnitrophota bacterium]
MKKIFKRKSVSVEPVVEPNVAVIIDKMQQQLTSLENKIDTLIKQSSERPSGGNSYSKPFRRFDNSRRFGGGRQDNNYRERVFTKAICAGCNTECEVPFKPTGDRPVYCKECFAKRKEGSGSNLPREDREDRRPAGREKPSFRRKKGRV